MKIELLLVGKTSEDYLIKGMNDYINRMKRYIRFEIVYIPAIKNVKNMGTDQVMLKEGEKLLNKISAKDYAILLDEKGKTMSSQYFADFINHKMNKSLKKMVFIVGGAYGCSLELQKRADLVLSLSNMTFSHQLVRLVFLEQLYRSFTIIKNEPYHHE